MVSKTNQQGVRMGDGNETLAFTEQRVMERISEATTEALITLRAFRDNPDLLSEPSSSAENQVPDPRGLSRFLGAIVVNADFFSAITIEDEDYDQAAMDPGYRTVIEALTKRRSGFRITSEELKYLDGLKARATRANLLLFKAQKLANTPGLPLQSA